MAIKSGPSVWGPRWGRSVYADYSPDGRRVTKIELVCPLADGDAKKAPANLPRLELFNREREYSYSLKVK
jgi:hypothetical protein